MICERCGSGRNVVADHCHQCGYFRGLLCRSCNVLEGQKGGDWAEWRKRCQSVHAEKYSNPHAYPISLRLYQCPRRKTVAA